MSPCGIGVISVTQLTSAKFWHTGHFCSFSSGSGGSGVFSVAGMLKYVLMPAFLHSMLIHCFNSSNVRPPPLCAFCASVVGEMHFTCDGSTCSMTLAPSISLIFLFRNCHWGGVSGRWWILVENLIFAGILSRCTVSRTWVTSLTASVKQLANLVMSAFAISHSLFVRSSLSVIASNMACTHSGLNALVWCV